MAENKSKIKLEVMKNKTMRGHTYGDAIKRVNINKNSVYVASRVAQDGTTTPAGIVFTHDISDSLPSVFYEADVLFIDLPYNLTMLKSYYTKADIPARFGDFETFTDSVFSYIRNIVNLKYAYIEIGGQNVDLVVKELKSIFGNVRVFEAFYCKQPKHRCFIVQAWKTGPDAPFVLQTDPLKDEMYHIDDIVKYHKGINPKSVILDFCLGRGAVSSAAFKHGMKFIGSDMNVLRLAVAVEELKKKGAYISEVK